MKKVSGTLKLDQAQFRELEAFAKFGSDLDSVTLNVIEKGKRNVEILKQGLNDPYTVENQVAIIYAGSKNLLRNVPVNKVKEFAVIASCAFLSFAAETIFIADVICIVDETEVILLRISFKFAIFSN